ncbi:LOW QUALITY PROTEIN: uncharacterized protein LOC116916429 [Daphnia magna]|uniref:LOW QUALITY PROTEIN: uncharacterized protein LOC116916429 n=1 Tax=Daphnia magna TaxID=35525 RepID=UPI0014027968|nr:LOW QUALITY PROTEIN: uncharacterized protein LOC116916429 [Daphnia magna]
MDGMAAMDRLEDSITSHTLQLKEFLEKANITDEDLDYFFNYTVVLVQKTETVTSSTIAGLDSDVSVSNEPDPVDGSYTGCGMGLHKPSVHLVHGILSLIICLAGCLANIVNIVVLSRRELRRNAINRILCSLAVADFLLMLEYIPFACHMYLFPGRSLQTRYSYSWAVFVLFHAHFTLVAHTVSIWLTLSLAFWRYEVLKNGRHQRRKNGRRCHQERCTRTIAMAYIGSVLLCIPSFITFGIQSEPIKNNDFMINQTLSKASSWGSSTSPPLQPDVVIYKVDLNRIAKNHDGIIHKAHLWAYSVVMKLGPCLVLTVLTCWLVRRLWEAERHHQSLTAKLNNDGRQHQLQEQHPQQQQHQQQQQGPMPTQPKPTTPLLRTRHENVNQISLTQQLEMRQLNSDMNRDAGVQIIVTEAAIADNIEPSSDTRIVKRPSLAAITLSSGDAVRNRQSELVIPSRHRRKLSVVEFSSIVMSTASTCCDREDGGVKTDAESKAATVVENEETVLDASAPPHSHVTTLNSTKSLRHKHQTDRTTRMLVAVLVLFLVTEIPQGVMALLSGVLGRQFFIKCYSTGMGEILDLLALLNSAINFLLYCSMSRQFRRAARSQFRRLFGTMTGGNDCHGGSPVDCFFRPKLLTQPQPINISPSIPTRCTQL